MIVLLGCSIIVILRLSSITSDQVAFHSIHYLLPSPRLQLISRSLRGMSGNLVGAVSSARDGAEGVGTTVSVVCTEAGAESWLVAALSADLVGLVTSTGVSGPNNQLLK